MVSHTSILAERALKLFCVLYDVEREVKEMDGQQRLRIRQIKSRPAANLLHAIVDGQPEETHPMAALQPRPSTTASNAGRR